MPQQGEVIEIELLNGKILKVPAAMSRDEMQALVDREMGKVGPNLPLQPRPADKGPDLGSIDPKKFVEGGVKAMTAATGFIPGAGLPSMAARTLLGAGGDALAAKVGGRDVLGAATLGGGLNAAAEGASVALPWGATRVALGVGGKLREFSNIGDVANAFARTNEDRALPILVGNRNRAKAARLEEGKTLENIERANPNSTSMRSIEGANNDFYQRSINAEDPLKQRANINSREQRFMESQALARNQLDDTSFRDLAAQTHNMVKTYQQAMGVPANQITDFGTVRQQLMNMLVDNTQLGAREVGELMRSLRTAGDAVQEARRAGTYVAPNEQVSGQITTHMSDRLKEIYTAMDQDTRSFIDKLFDTRKGGDMARSNARLSDLYQVERANNSIRRDFAGPIIRGAAGETIGSTILGLPFGVGSALGFMLGPTQIDLLGQLGGRASRYAPSVSRTLDGAEDIREGFKDTEKTTRLRKPK